MAEVIGNNIIKFEKLDSTNNYAIKHINEKGFTEGTVIFANEQLKGRGQKNNTWESEQGKNLLFSIVLFPHFLPVQDQFLLSKVVSLGICETISLYVEEASIKWPNDIYIGNKKIAGILIENNLIGSKLNFSIVGIGININQRQFFSEAVNPVSLFQLLNTELYREEVLSMILLSIDKWYRLLRKNEIGMINYEYLTKMFKVDIDSVFKDVRGVFNGRIVGVDSIGQLVIQKWNGEICTYGFKEIEFLI